MDVRGSPALDRFFALREVVSHLERGPLRLIPPSSDNQGWLIFGFAVRQVRPPDGLFVSHSVFIPPADQDQRALPSLNRRLAWNAANDRRRATEGAVEWPDVAVDYYRLAEYAKVQERMADFKIEFIRSLDIEPRDEPQTISTGWRLTPDGALQQGNPGASPARYVRRARFAVDVASIDTVFQEGADPGLESAWEALWDSLEKSCSRQNRSPAFSEHFTIDPKELANLLLHER